MTSCLWFRHGLRLHDNPSLHAALEGEGKQSFLPLFILDGQSGGTGLIGYNRMTFLLECLKSLDKQFKAAGGRLYVCRGNSLDIFKTLKREVNLRLICFEQDCEPIWKERDAQILQFCQENDVQCEERVGHTLWNPHDVIRANGGSPPLTFSTFNYIISILDKPHRPVPDVDLSNVDFINLTKDVAESIGVFEDIPTAEDLGVTPDDDLNDSRKVYVGGEEFAIQQFEKRLQLEVESFKKGKFLPNRSDPDILCPPRSLSPDLRYGTLSIRKFYWAVLDAYQAVQQARRGPAENPQIVAQLLWREFFYTMSVNNPYYGEMERNPICINVPWYETKGNPHWEAFKTAKTGYPFIDAGMRQMYSEGWIHHVVRNALACFLTRGDLWINWEDGLQIFLKYLLDADWSVCAGNWMWISSSAFEHVFNCGSCVDPGTFARRCDPWGEYVKRYIPELKNYPVEYLYEPWKAPIEVQREAGCVIGQDYPDRIVEHAEVVKINGRKMKELQQELIKKFKEIPNHCHPSDESETREFMKFSDDCRSHG